jgi:hydrogenase maturation protease
MNPAQNHSPVLNPLLGGRGALIYGYGNLGRKDDGLGVLCAQKLEAWLRDMGDENVVVETNYQLNIEDAELISAFETVYFIDASLEAINDVEITEIVPDTNIIEFSMHAMSPAYVLKLSEELFGNRPKAWLVHIKGYDWDFVEGLSPQARKNLNTAFEAMKNELVVFAT